MQSWRARLAALFEATETSSPRRAPPRLSVLTMGRILERLPLLFARQAGECDVRASPASIGATLESISWGDLVLVLTEQTLGAHDAGHSRRVR
jgi:hypothetical protein